MGKPKTVKLTPELVGSLERLLEKQWNPEQISSRLQVEGKPYLNLRRQSKKYRKHYGGDTGSVKSTPNRVDIDEHPEIANQRKRLGD